MQEADGSLFYGEKIVLLGDNGSGKTTLFKLLLGLLEADVGELELGSRTEIGYLAQQEPVHDGKLTVLDYFRTEAKLEEGEARNLLAKYLFYGAAVFKPLQAISGGEWTRLRLALLVLRKPNVLLLDEPTNHLDLDSREALEEALEQFPGTILAISHDRYFINRLTKRVWELRDGKITVYLGNYEEYKTKRKERTESETVMSGGGKTEIRTAGSPTIMGHSAGKTSEGKRGGQRKQKELEEEIAHLEAKLAAADEEMNRLVPSSDPALFETKRLEREEGEARLNALLEMWVTLSD